jgi:hypothetical protein
MGTNQYSGNPSGFQYGKRNNQRRSNTGSRRNVNNTSINNDDDLIIEENTIYEIDRECYERLKKQKGREK